MKTLLMLSLVFLCGCMRREGTIQGKVVDVHVGGLLFESCEIIIQKGESSSSMDQSSSTDKAFCEKAGKLLGKTVTIKYATIIRFIKITNTDDQIISLEEVSK